MVPEGWKMATIEDIASVSSGGTPSRKETSYWGGEIPWVTTTEVHFGTIVDTSQKITPSGLKNSSAKLFPKNTILMAMYGQGKTRGQVAKLGIEASTNQACAAILLKDGNNTDYYYHFLESRYEHIRNMANTGGQENLSAGIVKSIQVPIPPLPEQKKIAQILSIWDQAITATERLLENSQQRKKGLMQQLLTGKKRLPGFEGEWDVFLLGDLFAERREVGDENSPLLSITSSDGVVYQNKTGRKDTSNTDKSKYRRICSGDIGYNTMRMWQGRSSLSDKEGVVSPAYTILTPRVGADSLFFSYLFKLPAMVHVFYRHSQGLVSDTWNLKYNQLKKIGCKAPPKEEQATIAKVLLTSDFEIDALKTQVGYLEQEKKALMQQLLTGQRRVRVDTEAA